MYVKVYRKSPKPAEEAVPKPKTIGFREVLVFDVCLEQVAKHESAHGHKDTFKEPLLGLKSELLTLFSIVLYRFAWFLHR